MTRTTLVGNLARNGLRSSCKSTRISATHNHIQVRCYSEEAAGPSAADIKSARAYCINLIRQHDASSYTLQAFIPAPALDAYLALRAFNIDVARIADQTSNPAVGTMRMQFWRDAVTRALANAPPKEPVATLLAAAAASLQDRTAGRSRLSKSWLHRIITTRNDNLSNPPFPSLGAFESYAENTYSTLLYLTLSAVPLTSITADHLASHIGKAQGIAAILRGLPFVAFPQQPAQPQNASALGGMLPSRRQGSVLLPLDVMAASGVREEDVFRNQGDAKGLKDAVFTVATRANDHLITARQMMKTIRAGQEVDHAFEHADDEEHRRGGGTAREDVDKAFGVLMPALTTQMWLDKLQKYDFDVFRPELRTGDWSLPWKAYWAFKRKQL